MRNLPGTCLNCVFFLSKIHVVKEDRLYLSWPNPKSELEDTAFVKESDGILSAKKAINELHRWLGEEGYTQVSVKRQHLTVSA